MLRGYSGTNPEYGYQGPQLHSYSGPMAGDAAWSARLSSAHSGRDGSGIDDDFGMGGNPPSGDFQMDTWHVMEWCDGGTLRTAVYRDNVFRRPGRGRGGGGVGGLSPIPHTPLPSAVGSGGFDPHPSAALAATGEDAALQDAGPGSPAACGKILETALDIARGL